MTQESVSGISMYLKVAYCTGKSKDTCGRSEKEIIERHTYCLSFNNFFGEAISFPHLLDPQIFSLRNLLQILEWDLLMFVSETAAGRQKLHDFQKLPSREFFLDFEREESAERH